jgi:hypothetical protein
MKSLHPSRPSPALVISVIALIMATGGVGLAAFRLPPNSVGTRELKNGAVNSSKVKNHSLLAVDFKAGQLPAGRQGPKGDTGPPGPDTGAAGGDLSGNYPSPTIAPAPAPTSVAENPETSTDPCSGSSPQTAIFCGTTTSGFWMSGDYAGNGVQFWRDRPGEIHLRGDARSGHAALTSEMFVLPPSDRPAALQAFPIFTSAGAGVFQGHPALLVILPSGVVFVDTSTFSSDVEVSIGEVQFRTDG